MKATDLAYHLRQCGFVVEVKATTPWPELAETEATYIDAKRGGESGTFTKRMGRYWWTTNKEWMPVLLGIVALHTS